MDPGPYSLRELVKMAEMKMAREWDHTASLMWIMVRLHSSKGGNVTVSKFHPYMRSSQAGVKITPDNIQILKKVFVDGPETEGTSSGNPIL